MKQVHVLQHLTGTNIWDNMGVFPTKNLAAKQLAVIHKNQGQGFDAREWAIEKWDLDQPERDEPLQVVRFTDNDHFYRTTSGAGGPMRKRR